MTGPTTVGSIDAHITADTSDFQRGAASVRREARELGALSPNINVDANVGPALAGLAAVARAEAAVENAQRRATDTASASYLANLRLESVMSRRGRTELQVAVATENLARADRNAASAEARLIASTEALNAARATSVSGTGASSAATDTDTASTDTNTSANNRRISGLQVLLALMPAIVAAAAPVGAAAIGLGTAFGVMATAGVFAFKGVKQEMALGTTVGSEYSAGLKTMSGYMDALKHTSAVAMLSSFNQATSTLGTYMPNLNAMIGEFSGVLGQVGNTALTGVLRGMIQLNPLIQAGGVELGKFVAWLGSFSDNNGFSSFVQYAVSNLPPVMGMIEKLVTLAGNILAAFAPLGPVVVGFISGLSDALNGLPLPVLAGLVTSALLLGPALRLAFSETVIALIGKAAVAIGLTGTMAQLAVPVVGVLTAVIAGIAVASTAAALSTGQNTAAVQDYTQALKDDANAIGQHVRVQAAKALSDSGAFEAAKKLGIAQNILTDAALGNADAQNMVSTKVDIANRKIHDATTSAVGYANAQAGTRAATDGLGPAIEKVTGAVDVNAESIKSGQLANENMAAAMVKAGNSAGFQVSAEQALATQHGINASAYQNAVAGQKSEADQLADTTAKMYLQNDAAGILKAALDGLNGKALSAAQAQNQFDSSLVNMGDHVSATGKKITFTTTSIEDMSSASVALRGQLNSQITNLQNVVQANGGLANSTGAAREQMVNMRQQIIDNAIAHGVDADAVTQYIDKILAIPASVPPTKLDVDNAAAMAKLTAFNNYLAATNGQRATAYIDLITNRSETTTPLNSDTGGSSVQPMGGHFATGGPIGPVSYLAAGGFPGQPIGRDTVPIWGEPGEYMLRRSSAESIGAPALNYMNETGKIPATGGGGTVVKVYIDGKEMRSDMVQIAMTAADAAIDNANDFAGRRPSR